MRAAMWLRKKACTRRGRRERRRPILALLRPTPVCRWTAPRAAAQSAQRPRPQRPRKTGVAARRHAYEHAARHWRCCALPWLYLSGWRPSGRRWSASCPRLPALGWPFSGSSGRLVGLSRRVGVPTRTPANVVGHCSERATLPRREQRARRVRRRHRQQWRQCYRRLWSHRCPQRTALCPPRRCPQLRRRRPRPAPVGVSRAVASRLQCATIMLSRWHCGHKRREGIDRVGCTARSLHHRWRGAGPTTGPAADACSCTCCHGGVWPTLASSRSQPDSAHGAAGVLLPHCLVCSADVFELVR